jgi:hypothetical protein
LNDEIERKNTSTKVLRIKLKFLKIRTKMKNQAYEKIAIE